MKTMLLTAFWIVPPGGRGPLGFGVTAHSLADALGMIRAAGYGAYLFEDEGPSIVTEGIHSADLPEYVRGRMGPIVVRGLWYPFVRVGT